MTRAEYFAAKTQLESDYFTATTELKAEQHRKLTELHFDYFSALTELNHQHWKKHQLLRGKLAYQDIKHDQQVRLQLDELQHQHTQLKLQLELDYQQQKAETQSNVQHLLRKLKAELDASLHTLEQEYQAAGTRQQQCSTPTAPTAQLPIPSDLTYRQLIRRIHPDTLASKGMLHLAQPCTCLAKQLNEAKAQKSLTPALLHRIHQEAVGLGL